jgi:aspartate aminotransferase
MGPEEIIGKMKAILSHVGAWAPMAEQKALAKYLPQKDNINRYLDNYKKEVEERLHAIYVGLKELQKEGARVDAIRPEGAIYLTVQFDLCGQTTASKKLLKEQNDVTAFLLNEAKIALVPFYAFGASPSSSWYRLSVGNCKKEEIGGMLKQLSASLKGLN